MLLPAGGEEPVPGARAQQGQEQGGDESEEGQGLDHGEDGEDQGWYREGDEELGQVAGDVGVDALHPLDQGRADGSGPCCAQVRGPQSAQVGEEFVAQCHPDPGAGAGGGAPLPQGEPGAGGDDGEHRGEQPREVADVTAGQAGEREGQQRGLRQVREGDGHLQEGGREQGAPCAPCGAAQLGVDDHVKFSSSAWRVPRARACTIQSRPGAAPRAAPRSACCQEPTGRAASPWRRAVTWARWTAKPARR